MFTPCQHCTRPDEFDCADCDAYDSAPEFDDSVKCCPNCETPNQFGELCEACKRDLAQDAWTELEIERTLYPELRR